MSGDEADVKAHVVAFSASVASLLTKCLLHPVDTVKCRAQIYIATQHARSHTSSATSASPLPPHSKTTTATTTTAIGHEVPCGNSVQRYTRRVVSEWRGIAQQHKGQWGLRYLYGGLPIRVMFYVPYQAVYMTSYNVVQQGLGTQDILRRLSRESASSHDEGVEHRKEEEQGKDVQPTRWAYMWRTALAAIAAEGSSCVVRVPMETMKTRIQASAVANSQAALRQLRRRGLRPYARLVLPQTLMHDIPYSISQWLVYETLRPWTQGWREQQQQITSKLQQGEGGGEHAANQANKEPEQPTMLVRYRNELVRSFLSGGFSGLVASTLTLPLDNIRTRMLALTSAQPTLRVSEVIRRVYRADGLRGFTRGGTMRVLWVTTNMAFYFPIFEVTKMLTMHHLG